MEAGCDDVGIGALFGLYDWRFEVLALVAHALHLQEHYGVGPHTISFPRLRPASGVQLDDAWLVGDERLQAAGRHPAAGGALHRADPHRPRAGRPAPRGAGLRRLADRRRQPHRAGRLHRGRRRPGDGARAVPARRHPPAGRGDARTAGRRLHPQLLHRLLPPGPHRRALHGVRHPRLHPALLHAQRPDAR